MALVRGVAEGRRTDPMNPSLLGYEAAVLDGLDAACAARGGRGAGRARGRRRRGPRASLGVDRHLDRAPARVARSSRTCSRERCPPRRRASRRTRRSRRTPRTCPPRSAEAALRAKRVRRRRRARRAAPVGARGAPTRRRLRGGRVRRRAHRDPRRRRGRPVPLGARDRGQRPVAPCAHQPRPLLAPSASGSWRTSSRAAPTGDGAPRELRGGRRPCRATSSAPSTGWSTTWPRSAGGASRACATAREVDDASRERLTSILRSLVGRPVELEVDRPARPPGRRARRDRRPARGRHGPRPPGGAPRAPDRGPRRAPHLRHDERNPRSWLMPELTITADGDHRGAQAPRRRVHRPRSAPSRSGGSSRSATASRGCRGCRASRSTSSWSSRTAPSGSR